MPTILVTGATSGFGLAIGRLFGNKGWKVIGTGRRAERLASLQEELGPTFLPLTFDVRSKDAVNKVAPLFTFCCAVESLGVTALFFLSCQALGNLPNGFQDVDVLVNSAGLSLGLDPAHKASLEDWETMVDTNIKGLMYVTKAILPRMVERNEGSVVNIGSVAANYPYPGGNTYGATKGELGLSLLTGEGEEEAD